jgi:membrane-associated phospholipid phosphatase
MALMALAIALFPIDVWLVESLKAAKLPGDLRKAIGICEVFAQGVGVFLILLTLVVMVPGTRRFLMQLIVIAYGGGALTNFIKMLVARARPSNQAVWPFDLEDWHWIGGDGWNHFEPFGTQWHSFPSGHAATAAGLAFGLLLYFPRGRWLFPLFAAMAMLQRVVALAHYPSDVCAGASIGILWAVCCIHPRLLGRWLTPPADSAREPSP